MPETEREMDASDDPIEFIKKRLPGKLIGSHDWIKSVYYDDYNKLLARFQYNQSMMNQPIHHIGELSSTPVDPVLTLADEYYECPKSSTVLFDNRITLTTRALLAVRNYIMSQDVFDLSVVPTVETETVMKCLPFMEKIGSYWVTKKDMNRERPMLTKDIHILRDPLPSFCLYRLIVWQTVSLDRPEVKCVFERNDMYAIDVATEFLTDKTIRGLRSATKILFITSNATLPHFMFTDLTRVQAYALAIIRHFKNRKRFEFYYYNTSKSS